MPRITVVVGLTLTLSMPGASRADPPGNRPATERLFRAIKWNLERDVAAAIKQGADLKAVNPEGYPPLIWAVECKHAESVQLLLAARVDLEARTWRSFGVTALLLASQGRNVPIVKLLLAAGASLKAVDQHGTTALMHAARWGSPETVKLLLAAGARAEVDRRDALGRSALHYASQQSDGELVRLLLDARADPNARARNGDTPLLDAARALHLDAIRHLLRARATIPAQGWDPRVVWTAAVKAEKLELLGLLLEAGVSGVAVDARLPNGDTLLLRACRDGDLALVRGLLKARADVGARGPRQYVALIVAAHLGRVEVVKLLLAARAAVDARTDYGYTALMLAAEQGHLEVVKLLRRAGASAHLRNQGGETAWSLAAGRGHAAIVRLLPVVRALPPRGVAAAPPRVPPSRGGPPRTVPPRTAIKPKALIEAAEKGDERLVKELLAAGADVNGRIWPTFNSPLMRAAAKGHVRIIKLLLAHGADAKLESSGGFTVLTSLLLNEDLSAATETECLRLLLAAGAPVNRKDITGRTPLINAAFKKRPASVKLLLAAGADPSPRDGGGFTALMVAAGSGRLETVRLLIQAKADVNARSRKGQTVLTQAKQMGHLQVVRLLQSHGARE